MVSIRRADERGRTNWDWLDSRHSFSFGEYFDPSNMGHRTLRVINDDRVLPGAGFGAHPHRDMEILSYVLEGALEHRDSLGNGSVIRPGEIQHLRAGCGVVHSEYNPSSTEPAHFLQIWIVPVNAWPRRHAYGHVPFDPRKAAARLRTAGVARRPRRQRRASAGRGPVGDAPRRRMPRAPSMSGLAARRGCTWRAVGRRQRPRAE